MLDLLWALTRPLLFSLDAEKAHVFTVEHGAMVAPLLGMFATKPTRPVDVGGVRFAGPAGLAAGLDKDGVAIHLWEKLGFGAIEVGTVTAQAQPGNPKPRLFRLIPEEAVINRMGFNNLGTANLAERLRSLRQSGWPAVPVGVNIGKSKVVPNEEAVSDYLASLELLQDLPDYITINISSPNTPGLRALQEKEPLHRLLDACVRASRRPVFLKLAPDLEDSALSEAVEVAIQTGISAIIATNTTLSRPDTTGRTGEQGGLSGKPLRSLALRKIKVALSASSGRVPVIGVGGISAPSHAQEMLEAGCVATQVYTGLLYRGPGLVSHLNRALLPRLTQS